MGLVLVLTALSSGSSKGSTGRIFNATLRLIICDTGSVISDAVVNGTVRVGPWASGSGGEICCALTETTIVCETCGLRAMMYGRWFVVLFKVLFVLLLTSAVATSHKVCDDHEYSGKADETNDDENGYNCALVIKEAVGRKERWMRRWRE